MTGISVTSGGSGYSAEPTVTITGGGGNGATAKAALTADKVSSIVVLTTGSGYSTIPIVSIEAPHVLVTLTVEHGPKITAHGLPGSTNFIIWAPTVAGPWKFWTNLAVGTNGLILENLQPGEKIRFFQAMNLALVGPAITEQPQGMIVRAGQTAQFAVVGKGMAPLTYQWQLNGVKLVRATNASISIPTVKAANAGDYRVVVSNLAGSVTSTPAKLTVNPASPAGPEGFIWVSPGTFLMGSPTTELDRNIDEVLHMVTLTKGFFMGAHEVTQSEYQSVVGNNPSYFAGNLNRPVESVTWVSATNYCGLLTQQERAAGKIPATWAYRLPTEAEWEYAARAGTTTRFPWGDDVAYVQIDDYAWTNGNSTETQEVMRKLANPWGFYDMAGNVGEWCQDWYAAYPAGAAVDPKGPETGFSRMFRGGARVGPAYCRPAYRYAYDPLYSSSWSGFRVVLIPSP